MNIKGIFAALAVVIVVGLVGLVVIPHVITSQKIEHTRKTLNKEARRLLKSRGDVEYELIDAWNEALHYRYDEDPKVKVANVTSNGPDNIFGTGDDITVRRTDFNKSRIVGEWAGQKAKEGIKGVLDGLKKKSDFPSD